MNREGTITITKSLAMNQEECGTLIGIKGDLIGKYYKVSPNRRLLIGRDATRCDIVMTNMAVSGVHFEVQYDPNTKQYIVTDLSSNGMIQDHATRLRKNEPVTVAPGTSFLIGSNDDEIILG